jgi:hypothetical protein
LEQETIKNAERTKLRLFVFIRLNMASL